VSPLFASGSGVSRGGFFNGRGGSTELDFLPGERKVQRMINSDALRWGSLVQKEVRRTGRELAAIRGYVFLAKGR